MTIREQLTVYNQSIRWHIGVMEHTLSTRGRNMLTMDAYYLLLQTRHNERMHPMIVSREMLPRA